ncbi:MAG: SCO family protein [Acidobacteriota bacterium]
MNARRLGGNSLRLILVIAAALLAAAGSAAERHAMRGMVISVDPSGKRFEVSHDSVAGVMAAMTMSFDVRDASELKGLAPGTMVEFTLLLDGQAARAEQVRIRPYESVEQDPLAARRLKLLKNLIGSPAKTLAVGEPVPDFTLTDQARHPVSLSQLRGAVVAVNFIYTSCALPQFCFRTASQFGALQKRFKDQLGKDVVFLTVTFDPVRDQPEKLAEYASQWKPDPTAWHFLTGAAADIQRVCGLFGLDFFPDEGLINHSSRTAIIDRRGRLVANIEGNQFTIAQLGDLLDAARRR